MLNATVRVLRGLLVGTAICAAGSGLARLLVQPALGQMGTPASPLESGITRGAAAAALAVLGWLCAGALASLAAELPGRAGAAADVVARRVTPLLLRRMTRTLLGVSVALVPATPAFAAEGGSSLVAHHRAAATGAAVHPLQQSALLPGLPLPERPALPAHPARHAHPEPAAHPRAVRAPSVVVRRGDTLWDIAARHLGPHATDAEIAAAWPAWWRANAALVGRDPDVLLPGQVLLAP